MSFDGKCGLSSLSCTDDHATDVLSARSNMVKRIQILRFIAYPKTAVKLHVQRQVVLASDYAASRPAASRILKNRTRFRYRESSHFELTNNCAGEDTHLLGSCSVQLRTI